jgi:hypothetical protein
MTAICPGDGNKYIAGSDGNFTVIVWYCWLAGNIIIDCLQPAICQQFFLLHFLRQYTSNMAAI